MERGRRRRDWLAPAAEVARLGADFVERTIDAAGASGVVIGLSGGIDSAVSAALAVRGLGRDRVRGVFLPYRGSDPASLRDARAVAESLDLETELHDISAMADAAPSVGDADRLRIGNVLARCRMITLFDISARDGSLVLGTGNRTEILLGYATLHGDAAFGLNPLAPLYKAEVRALARHLDLPSVVLEKAPSADLWAGQTDEQELGFTYEEADDILHLLIDERLGPRQVAALGYAPDLVNAVSGRVRAQAFKWMEIPAMELSGRPLRLAEGTDPS